MSISFLLAAIIFPASEILLSVIKRSKKSNSTIEDQGTMKTLWLVIGISTLLAVAFSILPKAQFFLPLSVSHIFSIVCMVVGLCIRWSAIVTLGRMFTTNVAIQKDHELVREGLYAYIRHPSYSGLLLEFIGLGFFFANWVSIIILVVPITIAVLIRITAEEKVLINALGESYTTYTSETKRLIPRLW